MRKLSLVAALLAGSAISTPVLADGHLRIVDEPLELTIQMNHARYPIYEESWPVEQVAREMTGIHLINDTVGANMRTDENTGRTEALNLMLASGSMPWPTLTNISNSYSNHRPLDRSVTATGIRTLFACQPIARIWPFNPATTSPSIPQCIRNGGVRPVPKMPS